MRTDKDDREQGILMLTNGLFFSKEGHFLLDKFYDSKHKDSIQSRSNKSLALLNMEQALECFIKGVICFYEGRTFEKTHLISDNIDKIIKIVNDNDELHPIKPYIEECDDNAFAYELLRWSHIARYDTVSFDSKCLSKVKYINNKLYTFYTINSDIFDIENPVYLRNNNED